MSPFEFTIKYSELEVQNFLPIVHQKTLKILLKDSSLTPSHIRRQCVNIQGHYLHN